MSTNILNAITNKYMSIFGYAFYPPKLVQIEPTVRCNFSCVMCPRQAYGLKERNILDMDVEVFKGIVDKLPKGIGEIAVYGLGEPLLNKEIVKMIAIASKKAPVSLTTNGSLLNAELVFDLFTAGLRNIQISMDSPFKEVYEQIRKGGNYEKLVKNIITVVDLIKKDFSSVELSIKMVVFEENFDSMIEMIDLCAKLGVTFLSFQGKYLNQLKKDKGHTLWYREKIREIKEYAKNKKVVIRSCFIDILWTTGHRLCSLPCFAVYINCDGAISPCSVLWDSAIKEIYNIFKVDFSTVWNGAKIKAFRKALASKNKPETCSTCAYFYR